MSELNIGRKCFMSWPFYIYEIFLGTRYEPEFNEKAKKLAEKSKNEGQQVVFIKVKGLAPLSISRLINPELVSA